MDQSLKLLKSLLSKLYGSLATGAALNEIGLGDMTAAQVLIALFAVGLTIKLIDALQKK
jgi:hypothetical protein